MKLLIIVDFQKDFVDGSLGFERAKLLDDKICSLIDKYDDIIFTMDIHESNYLETNEGKMIPIKHCIRGSEGANVYGKVALYLDKAKIVIEKDSFGSLKLGEYLLKHQEYDTIDLCGLVSHICVFSNAVIVKNALPNANVSVIKEATDSYDKELEAKSFEVLKGLLINIK